MSLFSPSSKNCIFNLIIEFFVINCTLRKAEVEKTKIFSSFYCTIQHTYHKFSIGIQFFISCITGIRKGKECSISYYVRYCAAYTPISSVGENFLFNVLHDAGLEPDPIHIRKEEDKILGQLAICVKDHNNTCIKNVVHSSNLHCLAVEMQQKTGKSFQECVEVISSTNITEAAKAGNLCTVPCR